MIKLATLSNVFKLINNFSGPAQQIISASDNATKSIDQASQSADNLNDAAKSMANGTTKASSAMQLAHKYMSDGMSKSDALAKAWKEVGVNSSHAGKKIKDVGEQSKKSSGEVSSFTNSLNSLITKLISIAAIKKGIDIVDDMTNLNARLDNINDGLQTTKELQDKIFESANKSRGSYNSMADAVARLGTLAGDAFKSNDEVIAFAEVLQKSFKISGASTSEQAAAMTQLSQAMASGRLQGDEYVSIMENAPAVIQAITKYLGISKGELKELSSTGAISADVIKAAMFASADEINAKFENMPMTFGDIWTSIKNFGLQAFDSVINKINQIINTDGGQKAISAISRGFSLAADAANWLIDTIINNWPLIQNILVIMATVHLVTLIYKLWATIPPLLAQAAAWLSCCWPILLVIAIIGIAVAAARQFGASWEEILGFVGGLFGIVGANIYNTFVYIWNVVAEFINFFGNCFNDPVSAVQILFLNLANNVIGIIQTMAQGIEDLINKIPGVEVDLTGGLDSLSNKISEKVQTIKSESEWKEYVASKDFMDYSDGWSKGQEIGENAANSLENTFSDIKDMMSGFDGLGSNNDDGWKKFDTSGAVPIEGSGKGNKKVDVDISDENLECIRDIAEKDYQVVVKQDVLSPNLNVSFGDVHETADVSKIAKELERILEDEIATGKEGD